MSGSFLWSDYVSQCLIEKEGYLFWRARPESHFSSRRVMASWNAKHANTSAGATDTKGYLQVKINGRLYMAHHLVWLMHYGYLPDGIDHIDGNPKNNRISNLREVPHVENMRNQKRRSDNKTGLMGVHLVPRSGKWIAKLSNAHIGTFDTLLDACAARKSAEISAGYHANHGRVA